MSVFRRVVTRLSIETMFWCGELTSPDGIGIRFDCAGDTIVRFRQKVFNKFGFDG
jgi:hypothetical protein